MQDRKLKQNTIQNGRGFQMALAGICEGNMAVQPDYSEGLNSKRRAN